MAYRLRQNLDSSFITISMLSLSICIRRVYLILHPYTYGGCNKDKCCKLLPNQYSCSCRLREVMHLQVLSLKSKNGSYFFPFPTCTASSVNPCKFIYRWDCNNFINRCCVIICYNDMRYCSCINIPVNIPIMTIKMICPQSLPYHLPEGGREREKNSTRAIRRRDRIPSLPPD